MIVRAISNLDLLKVADESTEIYYGCNQEWYSTEWQRHSGCGPSVAANIVFYLEGLGKTSNKKATMLLLMEESWGYVTPTSEGIPTTKMFCDAMKLYALAKGLQVESGCFDLPAERKRRPLLHNMLNFIDAALLKDVPVAFLNLCNGEEKNLDSWHWVTIISLEYAEDSSSAFVNVLDDGVIKKIDLALWYKTTTLGGGFSYFTVGEAL